uniref:Uncharacterized protein n=1 Tax=Octopus bimaculoides TaxID=37653 RepID=A0A0L8G461_OCTBM
MVTWANIVAVITIIIIIIIIRHVIIHGDVISYTVSGGSGNIGVMLIIINHS